MIGDRIRELRKQLGITQQTMADMLHLSQRAVAHWETGYNDPPVCMVETICRTFKIPVTELFDNDIGGKPYKPSDPLETKLLDRFRQLDDDGKEMVLSCALAELRRVNQGMEQNRDVG